MTTSHFTLATKVLDTAALVRDLEHTGAGALVVFEGRVRNVNEGRAVLQLDYEAYEELALTEGARILAEAAHRFGLLGVRAVHRTGSLQLGEAAVWVGVLAGHRGEAFEACRWVIDEIKHRLPIWKREHYADGDRAWVSCEACASDHGHIHHPGS